MQPRRVQLNAGAGKLVLQAKDLHALDLTLPAPPRKQRLAMV